MKKDGNAVLSFKYVFSDTQKSTLLNILFAIVVSVVLSGFLAFILQKIFRLFVGKDNQNSDKFVSTLCKGCNR